MISNDHVLASMFFNNRGLDSSTANTSLKSSKMPGIARNSMLTLENIKMHDKSI